MPKPKEVASKKAVFSVGDLVKFDNNGEETEGTITSVDAKKKEADVEVEGLSDVLICDFDEMTVIPKGKKKAKEVEETPDPEERPAKKGGKKSLKGSFNSVPPADPRALGIPPGNHEALITEGLADTNDKGTSVYLQYVAVNGEVDGHSSRRFYGIYDADGDPNEQIIGFLKTDLMMLGLWDEDTEVDDSTVESIVEDLNVILKKLKKMQPWVSIRVQQKGEYLNIFLQQLMDDQDQKPDLPDKD